MRDAPRHRTSAKAVLFFVQSVNLRRKRENTLLKLLSCEIISSLDPCWILSPRYTIGCDRTRGTDGTLRSTPRICLGDCDGFRFSPTHFFHTQRVFDPNIRPNMAAPLPELSVPASPSVVKVSILNVSHMRGVNTWRFIEPSIKGHDWLATPCYSFLIQHPKLNRSLLFDLGIRKDWENFPPPLLERLNRSGYTLVAPKHAREILDEHGVDTKSIEALIWSHWHFDHTGNPSTFEPSTKLIVGPGCHAKIFPGYPDNPTAAFLQKDVEGREIQELDFTKSPLKIGRFPAIDYFGDGSFYLLDSPGHAIGHICGLARVTSSRSSPDDPDSFILMGGDAVHHGGELRPHPWHPLPESIEPSPFLAGGPPCPGALFEGLLREEGGKTAPFYLPAIPQNAPCVHHDVPEMIESIRKLQELDAHDNILVVAAHDSSILDVAEFFPRPANDFAREGWARRARWAFLKDFAEAVGYEGEITGKHDFSPLVKE